MFQCSNCNALLPFDEADRNSTVKCGDCNSSLAVPADLFSPRSVFVEFTLQRLVATGNTASIYHALQLSLEREVALKVLAQRHNKTPQLLQSFIRSARIAARFEHPNIVQCHALGEEEGYYYMACSYVNGTSLATLLEEEKALPSNRALRIIRQIAAGVDYMWCLDNSMHLAIKPENILLGENDWARLTGFASSRMVDEPVPPAQAHVTGTPQYISPERLCGETLDTRADVYGLGVTLFQMLTGKFPFEGDSPEQIARQRLEQSPPVAHTVNPHIPETVSQLVSKMMATMPQDRYHDMSVLAEEIDRLLQGKAPHGCAKTEEACDEHEPEFLLQDSRILDKMKEKREAGAKVATARLASVEAPTDSTATPHNLAKTVKMVERPKMQPQTTSMSCGVMPVTAILKAHR